MVEMAPTISQEKTALLYNATTHTSASPLRTDVSHPAVQGGHVPIIEKRRRTYSTNSYSLSIVNEDGDDIIGTSFGAVIVEQNTSARDWYLGLLLAVLSGLLFTANNFFVKFLSVDPLEMLLTRSALQSLMLLLALSTTTKMMTVASICNVFVPVTTKERVLVAIQGVLGGARVLLTFACVGYMPLGDALTLVFTEPLWTIVLSRLILGISIGLWKTLFGFLLVGGIVLCVEPPFLFPSATTTTPSNTTTTTNLTTTDNLLPTSLYDETYYLGVSLAVGAALTGSLANILVAKCEGVSSGVMVFYSGLGGVVVALGGSFLDPENRLLFSISSISLQEWGVLVLLGVMGVTGYFAMTRALKLIPPTTVAVLRAMEIVLAYIAQDLLMGERPDLLSVTGSSLVGVSVMAIALEEQLRSVSRMARDCYNDRTRNGYENI